MFKVIPNLVKVMFLLIYVGTILILNY